MREIRVAGAKGGLVGSDNASIVFMESWVCAGVTLVDVLKAGLSQVCVLS